MAYSKQVRDRNVVRWWLTEEPERARSRITKRIRDLRAAAHSRRELFYRYGDLYGTSIRYAHRPEKAGYRLTRLTYNYLKAYINVLVSQLTRGKVLPQVMTTGGSVEAERKAEGLNLFFEAMFDRCGVWDLDPQLTRDATVFGTGIAFVDEEHDEPYVERVLPTELDYDEFEWRNGNGRSLYRSFQMDRSVLCECYPDSEMAILAAPPANVDDRDVGEAEGAPNHDLVTVRRAWHLKSGPDANDGMVGVLVDAVGGMLQWEPYEHDDFPFAFMPYTRPLAGFWGESLAEDIAPGQLEIEFACQRLQDEFLMMTMSQFIAEPGTEFSKEKFNNEIGAVWTAKNPDAIRSFQTSHNPNLVPYIQFQKQSMSECSTVSPMAAMGQQPVGITAARALQLMDDQESERKIVPQRNREQCLIRIARLLKRACENIPGYSVFAKNSDGQVMDIQLAEVNIDDKDLIYSIQPTNFAAKNPSARAQQADDLRKLGVLQPQETGRFLGIPDVQKQTVMLNARRDLVAKVLEDMIYKGEWTPPDAMMDLAMARTMAGDYYAFALSRNVDEKRVQMIRDFAVMCEQLPQLGQAQQNLATIQPGMQAVAGLPGGSPPPSPGAPPPAGPSPMGMPNG